MGAVAGRRNIKLNTDTNFLKLIAIVTMLVDHVGAALLPQYRELRVVGRIAFPIFAYCLTVGSIYTHSMGKYLLRMLIMALISQPIYVLALHHTSAAMDAISFAANPASAAIRWFALSMKTPNILFSLLAGLLLIFTVKERKYILAALVFALIWYTQGYLNYGLNGILLMLLFYVFCDQPLTSFIWVGGFMLWWGLQGYGYNVWKISFGIQTFAMLSLPLIYIPMQTHMKINKYIFYLFYPVHLLAIYLIAVFILGK
jgi:hypothetical protein